MRAPAGDTAAYWLGTQGAEGMRILVVEDDALIAAGVVAGLRLHGMAVDHVARAAQARAALASTHFDAAVLDLGLPDEDGISLLQDLRRRAVHLPVLVLSARGNTADRVEGLRSGADDYLQKPFDLSELVARLHALMRRAAGRSADLIAWGPLLVDPVSGATRHGEQEIGLARREQLLLLALLNAQGRVLTAEQLKERIYAMHEDIESNALSVHIHHLRRKLGADMIETVRGLGYRLRRPA